MNKFSLAFFISTLFASAVAAHEFGQLKIDTFQRIGDGPYLEILLWNTVKGKRIVCALFNELGEVVATKTRHTDNLATKVFIRYEGREPLSARCVFN